MLKPKRITCPYLIIFVTARCNASCNYCFYKKKIQDFDASKETTLEEYKKISVNFKKIYHLSLSGGEPFLRNDLPEICNIFSANSDTRILTIPTNAYFIDKIKNFSEQIVKENRKTRLEIQLSLDFLGPDHDNYRNLPGSFEHVIKSYDNLEKLCKRYPNLRIKINTVFIPENQDKLVEIKDFVKNHMPLARHSLTVIHSCEPASIYNSLDPVELRKFTKGSVTYNSSGSYLNDMLDVFEISLKNQYLKKMYSLLNNFKAGKKVSVKCGAGKDLIVILENCDVAICETKKDIIGNLRNTGYNIAEILNEYYKSNFYLNVVKKRKCSCFWGCAVIIGILKNPLTYFYLAYDFVTALACAAKTRICGR